MPKDNKRFEDDSEVECNGIGVGCGVRNDRMQVSTFTLCDQWNGFESSGREGYIRDSRAG